MSPLHPQLIINAQLKHVLYDDPNTDKCTKKKKRDKITYKLVLKSLHFDHSSVYGEYWKYIYNTSFASSLVGWPKKEFQRAFMDA